MNLQFAEFMNGISRSLFDNTGTSECEPILFKRDHYDAQKDIHCPACAGSMIYIYTMLRFEKYFPAYFCKSCHSFYVPHEEEEQTPARETPQFRIFNSSLANQLAVEERNRGVSRKLLDHYHSTKSVIEIGCGPGWLLDEARKKGKTVQGFELNTDCVEYAAKTMNLRLRNEFFSPTSDTLPFDTLFCIMVFEHLQNPDTLGAAIAAQCRAQDAKAVISVPVIDEMFSLEHSFADPTSIKALFRYAPGHTMHYTEKGLEIFWRRMGASGIKRAVVPGSWYWLYEIEFNKS